MEDDASYVNECGFHKPVFRVTTEDIPDITEAVCMEHVIMKTISEINQFQEGLNVLGIGNLVKDHPGPLRKLFVHEQKVLTADDLDKLFLPVFSPNGSNTREKEEEIILNWKDYIHESEG